MKRPRYAEELLKIIFLWQGGMFIGMGILCFIGVLKPQTSSMVQEPALLGIIFSMVGLVWIIVQAILGVIVFKKNKLCSELTANGTKINGVVEQVYWQRYMQYGKQSPYVIQYNYIYQGKEYHHKSCFLWEKPDLAAGDSIMVCVNDSGKSTIFL